MTDRDTHFKNFARLLWEDAYNKLEFSIDTNDDRFSENLKQLIAQFAYDLVQSACIDISDEQVRQGVRLHPNAMLRAVADLTAWPPTTAD